MLSLFENEKRRKAFRMTTKRTEWMMSADRDPEGRFCKTSKCRQCRIDLTWGDRRYEFDHKDNNSANNSQRNCYLVCKNCHGAATKIDKRRILGLFGIVIGHETIKRKVGYKKPRTAEPSTAKSGTTRAKVAKAKPTESKTAKAGVKSKAATSATAKSADKAKPTTDKPKTSKSKLRRLPRHRPGPRQEDPRPRSQG